MKRLRCAIYTRKSSEEGLEQNFNSLDAQREACAAYVASQRHEGWHCLREAYDDGGFSGGSMDRPALKKLLKDIKAQKIDVVVVYKVDRLTRSLSDFAKIVEIFDAKGVSFVSVTQAFNTTTSMGRLTLNVLLSFAQYEREVTGERIRDKIAASKRQGLWMGGFVPPGYRADGRTLMIKEDEANIIRLIFNRYLELGTVQKLETKLHAAGIQVPIRKTQTGRTIGGRPFCRGQLYRLLSNPIYCGDIRHKDKRYPGQHDAIVSSELFEDVQQLLAANRQGQWSGHGCAHLSLLAGLLTDATGQTLVASHATKAHKRYRYYISRTLHAGRGQGDSFVSSDTINPDVWRLPADQIESVVLNALKDRLSNQIWLRDTAKALMGTDHLPGTTFDLILTRSVQLRDKLENGEPTDVRAAITRFIARVALYPDHIVLVFNRHGLAESLGIEMQRVSNTGQTIEYKIQITLQRKGIETKLVINDNGRPIAEPDHTMIRALARARRWMNDLIDGRYPTMVDLAKCYGTDPRYVARHIPLACLAPNLVEAILQGRQSPGLTTWDLLNRIDVPFNWDDQKQRLGFIRSTHPESGPRNLGKEKTGL